MSKKIASLYAEIGGDTSKLDTALTGTKTKLTGIKGAASNMSSEVNSKINSMIAPAALASAAIYGIKDALDTTVTYAKQVEDLSRLIGATPEEASKLIQVGDDVRISYGTMQTALEAAIRNGFDPSIEGLKTLTDKYQSIQDPIDRSKFLMETFGKSGADMAPLLELPRQRLDELAESADKVGLVMSGDDLKAAKDYAMAMDDLEDKVNAVKIKLGNELIPHLTWFIDNGSAVEDSIEKQKLKWMDLLPVLGAIRDAILWIKQAGATLGGKDQGGMNWNTSSTHFNTPVNGYANGADFIVPPGFNNDSFPMRVQSGEHVTVTPAGQTASSNAELLREIRGLRKDILKTAFGMGAQ